MVLILISVVIILQLLILGYLNFALTTISDNQMTAAITLDRIYESAKKY